MAKLESLMEKISKQDYNYSEMKNALESVSDVVNENLSAIGENVNTGFFDKIKSFFEGIVDWFKGLFGGNNNDNSSILNNTNDSLLGENAKIDATDKSTINLPSSEQVEGFFAKIWNWFTGLFDGNDSNKVDDNNATPPSNEESNSDSTGDSSVDSLEQNSTVDENVQPDSSINPDAPVENSSENLNSTNVSNNKDTLNTPDSENTTNQVINY